MIDLKAKMNENEKIVWEGKPSKKCFLLETFFNPTFFYSVIWLIVVVYLSKIIYQEDFFGTIFFMIPVLVYLGGILFCSVRYRNIRYLITDIGVYISGGIIKQTFEMKPWTELSDISVERGYWDQKLGVGDVVFYANDVNKKRLSIINISDYDKVFKLSKTLQRDIYADTTYPNEYRPKENKGYNTEYKVKE